MLKGTAADFHLVGSATQTSDLSVTNTLGYLALQALVRYTLVLTSDPAFPVTPRPLGDGGRKHFQDDLENENMLTLFRPFHLSLTREEGSAVGKLSALGEAIEILKSERTLCALL